LILAIDTSSQLGSVALSLGGVVISAQSFEADHGHSRKLLPAVDSIFLNAGVQPEEVATFAAVTGPGSFTGLRVALSCVRGLAGARPCFGALATDVAAWAGRGRGGPVLALVDLFHGEVFGAVHDQHGALVSGHESGEVAAVLTALGPSLIGHPIVAGSAAHKHRSEISTAFEDATFLNLEEGLAPHLATLAAARASAATTSRASDLMPFYLRDPLTRGLLNTQPKPAVGAARPDVPNDLVLAPASSGDLDALVGIDAASPRAWTRTAFEEELRNDPPTLLCLRTKAGVAGFVVARHHAPELDIVNLAIAESGRRQGLGATLLRLLVEKARLDGVRRLFLEVREGNLAALRLYRKSGFRETQRRRAFYRDPVEDAILMSLEIEP